ncbi:MAG: phosphoribosylglycinamide formyltransferase [Candidatus Liptonbacteria bacterium]|nr:phosphoribosylglycinamide formyltransferase [Candidatus Liptonbacteria bacterium]
MKELRLALLISGSGTTAEAVIRASKDGRLAGVEVACVIVSKPGALGIVRALRAGVPEKDVAVCQPRSFPSSKKFGEQIIKECKARGADFVGQYGWLVKTPENVIEAFAGRIVNQHPGPLDPGRPDFGGKGMFGRRVHAARLFFVRAVGRDFWTEMTTHRVVAEYDMGAVVNTRRIVINLDDTPESLQERALPIEHELQIETLGMFVRGDVKEMKRTIPLVLPGEEKILEEAKQKAILMYPNG